MKPHPRIRKTIKWGGAAVTVLLVVAWIGSGLYGVDWNGAADLGRGEYRSIELFRGRVYWGYDYAPGQPHHPGIGWCTNPQSAPFVFNWWFFWNPPPFTALAVPLWPLCGFSLLATWGAWRLDTLARRRARVGFCPKCGYDRTGLVGVGGAAGAVCPECGRLPT